MSCNIYDASRGKLIKMAPLYKDSIPDGKTVVPTDDIQILLKCAGVKNKDYTTLAELLEDTATLTTVINSNNAIDYLVRSTTFAGGEALVPAMTSDNTPSGECFNTYNDGSNIAYKAFDGNDSSITAFVAHTPLTDIRVGYHFTSPCKVNSYKVYDSVSRITAGKLVGSNDGVTWVDLDSWTSAYNNQFKSFAESISYEYYAFQLESATHPSNALQINTIQFAFDGICQNSTAMTDIGQNNYAANTLLGNSDWCNAIWNSTYKMSVINAYVPVMTDYTTPSGEVIESGHRTDLSDTAGWYAFGNKSSSRGWFSQSTGSTDTYLGYVFTNDIRLVAVVISPHTSPNTNSYLYDTGYIQGSNDSFSTFDNISTIEAGTYTDLTVVTPNNYKHRAIRIFASRTGSNYNCIRQIQFYGRVDI